MEKFPQPNTKKEEEVNINEKIGEYKEFINSLRLKYANLLDYKFESHLGTVAGSPDRPTFFFQPKSLADYKESFDESQRITEEDEVLLFKIKRLINDNIFDSSKYVLSTTEEHTLSEWLNKFDQGLDSVVNQ